MGHFLVSEHVAAAKAEPAPRSAATTADWRMVFLVRLSFRKGLKPQKQMD